MQCGAKLTVCTKWLSYIPVSQVKVALLLCLMLCQVLQGLAQGSIFLQQVLLTVHEGALMLRPVNLLQWTHVWVMRSTHNCTDRLSRLIWQEEEEEEEANE